MNEPKRWAEANSEVDPVVRSLLRHAQSRAPSELDVARLIASVERRTTPRARRGLLLKRAVRVAAWAAVAAIAGVVGAVVGPRLGFHAGASGDAPAHGVRAVNPALRSGASPAALSEPVAPGPASAAEAPLPSSVGTVPRAREVAADPRPEARPAAPSASAPSASAPADGDDDVETLTQARRVMALEPWRALALTEASARRNPKSPVAEEREAMTVEALLRLGRDAEAKQRLQRFEQRFPSSPYRRRLNAWLSH